MLNKKEYWKKYYEKYREKILKGRKEWQKTEKGKISHKESMRKYYKKNREYMLKNAKIRQKNNREKSNKNQRMWMKTEKGKANRQRGKFKRQAREGEIVNTLTSTEWLDLLEEYNYRCAYCDVEFDCELLPEKDHVIPISKGGNNTKENIVPACRSCNSKKNNKIIKEVNLYGN